MLGWMIWTLRGGIPTATGSDVGFVIKLVSYQFETQLAAHASIYFRARMQS